MLEAFHALRARGARGPLFWLRLLADALVTAVLERLPRRGRRPSWFWLGYDLRLAIRSLAKRPGFAFTGLIVLTLGIGASSTVFAVARAVLGRLPYPHADGLVYVWGSSTAFGRSRDVMSGPNYIDLRERNRTLSGLAAFKPDDATLYYDDAPVLTDGLLVTPEFLDVLGVEPAHGRDFEPNDGAVGSAPAVIISDALWRRYFRADPAAIGASLRSYDQTFTVVGILPPTFTFPFTHDILFPLGYDGLRGEGRTSIDYWAVGRLHVGASAEAAQADLSAIMADLRRLAPSLRDWDVRVDGWQDVLTEYLRPPTVLLGVAAALILLISCANLGALLLARGIGRTGEFAVRSALGASPYRLGRHLVAESLVLGGAGGVTGSAAAAIALDALPAILPQSVPVQGSAAATLLPAFGVDLPTVGFAIGLALLTATAAGLAPVLRLAGTKVAAWLREGSARGSATRATLRAQRAVITGELAFTIVLLVLSGIVTLSTLRLISQDSGLDARRAVTMYFGSLDGVSKADRAAYYADVLRTVREVPGVTAAGINDYVPLQQEDDFEGITIPDADGPQSHRVEWRRVSAGYFEAAGERLIQGRFLDATDLETGRSVAVVNHAFAERFWPGGDVIGRHVVVHQSAYAETEIVGVVSDVREYGLDVPPPPILYVPYHRSPRPVMALFARTAVPVEEVIDPIRRAIWSVDPRQPIDRIFTLRDVVRASVAIPRMLLGLTAMAAGMALLLAAVGVYGVISFSVADRKREFGIRMALGGTRERIQRSVMLGGLQLVGLAVPIGALGALAAARLAASRLFGVGATEPLPYLVAAGTVAVIVLVACFLPAKRASSTAPMAALTGD